MITTKLSNILCGLPIFANMLYIFSLSFSRSPQNVFQIIMLQLSAIDVATLLGHIIYTNERSNDCAAAQPLGRKKVATTANAQ